VLLKDKIAVVTGAGGGLGSATSLRLAEEGARVVVNDVNGESAQRIAAAVRASGGEAIVHLADVGDPVAAQKLIDTAVWTWGGVDILVNNAGFPRDYPITEMPLEAWRLVLNVCLNGTFYCSQAAARHMVPRRSGKIISISSRAWHGNPGQVNYSAAKAGIVGFTRALAKELGRYGINVNCIAPGLILHEGIARIPNAEKFVQRFIDASPLGRAGEPVDIANAVVFLASEESSYVTGEVLHVSGGRF
jgi:3-oxoacyl-[acyl-carrier protein] reductase